MEALLRGIIKGIEPEPNITVTQWADSKRVLPDKGSIEPGDYNSARTPYMIEIMDCLSVTSPVTDVTFVKATQLGATEGGTNWMGYVIDVAPGPMLIYLPTNELASDHSKVKITPTIEATPCLREKVAELKGRSSYNTIMSKDFPGGMLFIKGANSPAGMRNKSIRYLQLDDYDGIPIHAGKEGDPGDLAEKRTDTYGARKKIYRNSTPTVKGLSRIWEAWLESDQRKYKVPCPFCGYKQELVWGGPGQKKGIKFKRNNIGVAVAAWYECAKCHKPIDESHKTEMLAGGKWFAKYKRREKRGYHLSSLYSPVGWVSWLQVVKEFLVSKDSPERFQVWKNTRMAEVWDDEGSRPKWKVLRDRAEAYPIRAVPDPAVFLTAGVDVGANYFDIVVRGWGPGEESYLVYTTKMYGDTSQPGPYNQLDMMLEMPFKHVSGTTLYIDQMAIDSGFNSHAVYNYCRTRKLKTMATKGSTVAKKPLLNQPNLVDINYMGEKIKKGCQLWMIGTDVGKTQIYHRLSMEAAGPGYYHFPVGVEDEYYKQLSAEKKVLQYKNGFPNYVWMLLYDKNHKLDCELLALAAAYRAGMAFVNWDRLREKKITDIGVKKRATPKRKKPAKRARKW